MKKWLSSTAFAQRELAVAISPDVRGCTVKAEIESGLGGSAFRLVFAEDYGKAPAVYAGAAVEKNGLRFPLYFGGKRSFTVAPGQRVISDKVEAAVEAGETISLYLSVGEGASGSETSLEQCHSGKGDFSLNGFEAVPYKCPLPGAPFNERLCGLKELQVEVEPGDNSGSIAVLGDSVAESAVWIKPLQEKLKQENSALTVLNLGIGGNRLLRDTNVPMMMGTNAFGKAGLQRLESDILSLSGVKAVILALGINDISQPGGMPGFSPPAQELCSAQDLKEGLARAAAICRENSIVPMAATITPFKGFPTYNDVTAAIRSEVNEWIRSSGIFDAVLDLAVALGSEEDPESMPAHWQVGDSLHPNPIGGAAAVESFDIKKLLSAII